MEIENLSEENQAFIAEQKFTAETDLNTVFDAYRAATNAPAPKVIDGLSEENATLAKASGWGDDTGINTVLDKYRSLEASQGEALTAPGQDATSEDWLAFHRKTGGLSEETAKDFQFKMPKGLPAELPYDEKEAERLKQIALEAGLTPAQAQIAHDREVTRRVEEHNARMKAMGDHADASMTALEKTWKAAGDSDEFKARMEFADKAVNHFEGLSDELINAGLIHKNDKGEKIVMAPKLVDALSRLGEKTLGEDVFARAKNVASNGGNPWLSNSFNLTGQMRITKADPELARQLKSEAGIK